MIHSGVGTPHLGRVLYICIPIYSRVWSQGLAPGLSSLYSTGRRGQHGSKFGDTCSREAAMHSAMGIGDSLDILGQQPGLDIYTQLFLIYPMPEPSLQGDIINTLTDGLEKLAQDVPWVAGQVIKGDATNGGSGGFRITPFNKAPSLTIRDLRGSESALTMDSLRQARFPFSMLDEDVIAPQKTLPRVVGSGPDARPVFAMQANFIAGGLILTFVSQHQTMDLTGRKCQIGVLLALFELFRESSGSRCSRDTAPGYLKKTKLTRIAAERQVMSLLSRLCRGDKLTDTEIANANPDRRGRIIPSPDESISSCPGLTLQTGGSPVNQRALGGVPAAAAWAYFAFSADSLATIKHLAMDNVANPPGFVSTDDALTAFIWQSVGRVRMQRMGSDEKSTLGRAVDVRRHLGVPEAYPGLMQNLAFQTHTMQQLVQIPLGCLASELRLAVDPSTSKLARATRALAALTRQAEDKSTVSLTAGINPSVDLLISSWANPSFYEMDFGLRLGAPEAVRRPCFVPVEGLGYLMPKSPSGEVVVAICLRKEDLQRLRADDEFSIRSAYIG